MCVEITIYLRRDVSPAIQPYVLIFLKNKMYPRMNWLTMTAVGLIMEMMLVILGPLYFAFFLIFWVMCIYLFPFFALHL